MPILYVDDEHANRLVFTATFSDEFDVVVAVDGPGALTVLATQPIGVLVTDHRMPGMSGVDLCEAARDLHPDVMRILVTAYSGEATAIESINRGGVSRYIRKPWEVTDVRQVLRQATARVALEHTVRQLRASIEDRERLLGESAARRRLLADLGTVGTSLAATCGRLVLLESALRRELAAITFDAFAVELHALQNYVEFVGRLSLDGVDQARPAIASNGSALLPIVEAAVRLARGRGDGPVRVRCSISREARVWADPTDLTRALVRVVSNSVTAARAAATVVDARITAVVAGNTVTIEISDGSPPIPSAELAAWIATGACATTEGRLSRGLSEAVALIAGLGGALDVAQPTPSRTGNTFLLRLPVNAPSAAPRLRQT